MIVWRKESADLGKRLLCLSLVAANGLDTDLLQGDGHPVPGYLRLSLQFLQQTIVITVGQQRLVIQLLRVGLFDQKWQRFSQPLAGLGKMPLSQGAKTQAVASISRRRIGRRRLPIEPGTFVQVRIRPPEKIEYVGISFGIGQELAIAGTQVHLRMARSIWVW